MIYKNLSLRMKEILKTLRMNTFIKLNIIKKKYKDYLYILIPN